MYVSPWWTCAGTEHQKIWSSLKLSPNNDEVIDVWQDFPGNDELENVVDDVLRLMEDQSLSPQVIAGHR